MRALASPARVRIRYPRAIEEWVQFPIQRVMEQPVAHARLVDVTGFGVGDFESVVAAVAICSLFQLAMEHEDVVHEPLPEFLHVTLFSFAAQEFPPCRE